MNPAVHSAELSFPEGRLPAASPIHTLDLAHVQVRIAPRLTVDKTAFIQSADGPAIALDGYVPGPSWVDYARRVANFNHHEGVVRSATLATCGQVHRALKNGFIKALSVDGEFAPSVHVNDADEDVCLSVWLIENFQRVRGLHSEPLINQIVSVETDLDMSGGCCAIEPDAPHIRKIGWVFEPYADARTSGRISKMAGAEMANLITAVGDRITRFTLGKAGEITLDTRFDVLGGGEAWMLIAEHGYHARLELASRGLAGFVSVKELGGGRYQYSIGKASPFSSFPVDELYPVLNLAEGIALDAPNRWNGSDTIGGSPRDGGSALTPCTIEAIINGYLQRRDFVPRAA